MAWSSDFLTYLSGNRALEVWIVEVYLSGLEPGGGDGYMLSSCKGYGDEVLLAGPPSITGPRVNPANWSSTIGSATIELAGSPREALRHMVRGSILRIRMGLYGQLVDDFETILWGQLWDISGSGVGYTMEIRDALQVLDGRISRYAPSLFAFSQASLVANINSSVTTLTIASTTGWSWDEFGSGIGLLRIGDELITFTAVTATDFTGCTRGALGTTAAAHTAGDTVDSVAYLHGHPLDIVRRLLLSHHDPGNSVWDDYPEVWGWGIKQTLVDIDDIELWKTYVVKVASGTYNWGVVSLEAVDTPSSWLTDILSRSGLFLTVRQGLLTCRAGVSPLIALSTPPLLDLVLTDADIVAGYGGIRASAFAPQEAPAESLYVSVTSNSTTLTGSDGSGAAVAATLPATRITQFNIADYVRSNETEVCTEVLNRVALFAERVPEAVTVTCAGMRMAQLAPGDVLYVQSDRLGLRFSFGDGTTGRRCWVSQVSPDWRANTVSVRLLAYPSTREDYEP